MDQFSDEELESSFFGYLVCLWRDGIDRRTMSTTPVDPGTGLPISADDLLPMGYAKYGDAIIYEFRIEAHAFAVAFAGLTHKRQVNWTAEEASWVARTTVRLKQLMLRHGEQGHLRVRPMDLFTGQDMSLGPDGMPVEATMTPAGLKYARELVAGTKYEQRRATSILDGAPTDVVANAPEWAKSNFQKEKN